MSDLREAAGILLKAIHGGESSSMIKRHAATLKEALAQTEQSEPFGYLAEHRGKRLHFHYNPCEDGFAIYTTPQPLKMLSDEEIGNVYEKAAKQSLRTQDKAIVLRVCKAIMTAMQAAGSK